MIFNFFLVEDKNCEQIIFAYDKEIGALAINSEGTLIASSSHAGHIIRIFVSDTGEVV